MESGRCADKRGGVDRVWRIESAPQLHQHERRSGRHTDHRRLRHDFAACADHGESADCGRHGQDRARRQSAGNSESAGGYSRPGREQVSRRHNRLGAGGGEDELRPGDRLHQTVANVAGIHRSVVGPTKEAINACAGR